MGPDQELSQGHAPTFGINKDLVVIPANYGFIGGVDPDGLILPVILLLWCRSRPELFPPRSYLQKNLASIRPRPSPLTFADSKASDTHPRSSICLCVLLIREICLVVPSATNELVDVLRIRRAGDRFVTQGFRAAGTNRSLVYVVHQKYLRT